MFFIRSVWIFIFLAISSTSQGQRLPLSGHQPTDNDQIVSNPQADYDDLVISSIGSVGSYAVRLALNPSDSLIYLLYSNGTIFSIDPDKNNFVERFNSDDHGLSDAFGMIFDQNNNIFLVGNRRADDQNTGVIIKGADIFRFSANWSTIAETEPYPLSNTAFDHTFNGIAINEEGTYVYVNSGSRTDHGEIQSAEGKFPYAREVPITSAILKIPTNQENQIIRNDMDFLIQEGYLFADGVRNTFDLAFSSDGRLYGVENAGDRDDSEEMNWLREGEHYGFPWNMGGNETPMQFEGYDPDSDLLVNKTSIAYTGGFFYDDPDYPEKPASISFAMPMINRGPDADKYRNPESGDIIDASDNNETLTTFTSHRSPLGLIFDTEDDIPTFDAFVCAWTGSNSNLLGPMNDPGHDLIGMLNFRDEYDENNNYITTSFDSYRIAHGFENPIDALQIGSSIYVLEFVFGGTGTLWRLDFDQLVSNQDLVLKPSSFLLNQNYPNPFNPNTTITFELREKMDAQIEVVNVLGKVVFTRDYKQLSSGLHSIHIDAKYWASGIYLYTLRTSVGTITKKMTLIK